MMKFLIIFIIVIFAASITILIAKHISHKKKQGQELTKEEQEEVEKKEYRQLCAEIQEHPNELRRMVIGCLSLSVLFPLIILIVVPNNLSSIERFDFKTFIAWFIFTASTCVIALMRDEEIIIAKRQKKIEYELSHAQDKVEEDLFKNSINMSYTYLNQYYAQTREQAKSGFFITVSVAIFGAILISIGVLLLFFGTNDKITPAYITCASGVITEFISSIFFAMYNKTVTSMNSYHDKLVLSQNVAFALRIAGEIDGIEEKNKAKLAIINELVKDVNAQMMKSDGDADEPPKKAPPSDSETAQ